MLNVEEIQTVLAELRLDGWLMYDFGRCNPIAYKILGLPADLFCTRRWFVLIPARGEPVRLVSRIEPHTLAGVRGKELLFSSWTELQERLNQMLQGLHRVAMEYSPHCAIPYVSRVDAGTVELVRRAGVAVVSSADLVQWFEARWSEEALQSHLQVSRILMDIKDRAFGEISAALQEGRTVTEFGIQQFMVDLYRQNDLVTSAPPIVAVNEHSGNPHFMPSQENSRTIHSGDLVLLDYWAKLCAPDTVYADYTWMAYAGESIPERFREVWEAVKGARDAAIRFVENAVERGEMPRGYEVDDVARHYISQRGYGEYFIHRTGHSIGIEDHGNGANIDNFETHDERRVLPRTAFSIEPGIYLPDFGVRSEVNVYVGEREVLVTGTPIQQEIVRLPISF